MILMCLLRKSYADYVNGLDQSVCLRFENLDDMLTRNSNRSLDEIIKIGSVLWLSRRAKRICWRAMLTVSIGSDQSFHQRFVPQAEAQSV